MSVWDRVALARELVEPKRVARALAKGQRAKDPRVARRELQRRRMWAVARDDEAGPVIFGRGAPLASRPHVAVVGARAADAYGLALARRVALDVVALGGVVVSGGAEGCDGAAHAAVLDAGGVSVVVFGGGHDHPYPACHRGLFEAIAMSGGTLLSPYWPEVRPRAHRFIHRNTVIAALSDALVVVRAGPRSGSLAAARAARQLEVPVFAVPGDVGQHLSAGPHRLLQEGAHALVGPRSLQGVLGAGRRVDPWPVVAGGSLTPWSPSASQALSDSLDPLAESVLHVVQQNPGLDLDGLVVRTESPVDGVAAALLDLELSGRVARLAGQRYTAIDCRGEVGPKGPGDERAGH